MLYGTFTLATAISLIVSVIIPLVSSLLARAHWPAEIAGILTLALAAVNGFFTDWASTAGFHWQAGLKLALISFVVAILSRYGLWKGTITDAKLLAFPTPRAVATSTPPAVVAPAVPPATPAT